MNVIVAVDSNWGIGYAGTQAIVLAADRKHFRDLTDGGIVIVGRKTLEDFPGGNPLKNRTNIIITKNPDYQRDGAIVVHDLKELSDALKNYDDENIFVVGGDSIFRMLLPYCKYAYLTIIQACPVSDRFFPNLDADPDWVIDNKGSEQAENGTKFSFVKYKNLNPKPLMAE